MSLDTIKYYAIGCDCHPTHVLDNLKLKHKSGPFDYLYFSSTYCPKYFMDLINSSFKNFLDEFIIKENNMVYSKFYPHIEFTHDSDIVKNIETKNKYQRRIDRFLDDYNNDKCVFLLNINYTCLKEEDDVKNLSHHIKNIINDSFFQKKNHILYIYLRYDENYEQNKTLCDLLIESILNMKKNNKNIYFKQYCRNKSQYGIWGNTSEYSNYFSDLFEL